MVYMTDEECADYDREQFPDGFDEAQWQANRDRPMPAIQMIDVAKLEAEEAAAEAELAACGVVRRNFRIWMAD